MVFVSAVWIFRFLQWDMTCPVWGISPLLEFFSFNAFQTFHFIVYICQNLLESPRVRIWQPGPGVFVRNSGSTMCTKIVHPCASGLHTCIHQNFFGKTFTPKDGHIGLRVLEILTLAKLFQIKILPSICGTKEWWNKHVLHVTVRQA